MAKKERRRVCGNAVHRCRYQRRTNRHHALNRNDRKNCRGDLKPDRWSNVSLRQRRVARAVLV